MLDQRSRRLDLEQASARIKARRHVHLRRHFPCMRRLQHPARGPRNVRCLDSVARCGAVETSLPFGAELLAGRHAHAPLLTHTRSHRHRDSGGTQRGGGPRPNLIHLREIHHGASVVARGRLPEVACRPLVVPRQPHPCSAQRVRQRFTDGLRLRQRWRVEWSCDLARASTPS